MKINDILKEENAGKVYRITNGEYEGEMITITRYLTAEITLNGRTDDIEDVIHLIDILEMEFEEEKPYKEISGREALKILLDDGVVYGDKNLRDKYYIEGDNLVYKDEDGLVFDSNLFVGEVLSLKWYIKN